MLLQAFLQRIVNGGGDHGRESGLGRTRSHLLIAWPVRGNRDDTQKVVMGLRSAGDTVAAGASRPSM